MSIKTRKIGIIGAGNVGSHLALQFAVQGLADEVVFYDTNNDKAIGESLDLLDAVSYQPHHFEAYAGTVDDMKDADILINASGKLRLQGQNRLDMMDGAIATSKEFLPLIKKSDLTALLFLFPIPVTLLQNTCSINWTGRRKRSSVPARHWTLPVCRCSLSTQLKVNRRSLTAYLLGEHGDSSMIPWSHVKVAGKPIDELLKEKAGSLSYGFQRRNFAESP